MAAEDSSTIDYHFAMVRLYAKLDDIDSARTVLIAALEEFEDIPNGFTLDDFGLLIDVAPDYPVYYYRALHLYNEREYETAVQDFTSAIDLGMTDEAPDRNAAHIGCAAMPITPYVNTHVQSQIFHNAGTDSRTGAGQWHRSVNRF
ncbi:MAG: hypothetical protein R2867_08545 [Caldilineaceae bacterium]